MSHGTVWCPLYQHKPSILVWSLFSLFLASLLFSSLLPVELWGIMMLLPTLGGRGSCADASADAAAAADNDDECRGEGGGSSYTG